MSAKKLTSTRRCLAVIALLVVAPVSCLDAQTATPSAAQPVVVSARAVARAARATQAPSIDGRDDDAAWRDATPITGFRQFDPVEDSDPSMRTDAGAPVCSGISKWAGPLPGTAASIAAMILRFRTRAADDSPGVLAKTP
jgi:hypothetical protein